MAWLGRQARKMRHRIRRGLVVFITGSLSNKKNAGAVRDYGNNHNTTKLNFGFG